MKSHLNQHPVIRLVSPAARRRLACLLSLSALLAASGLPAQTSPTPPDYTPPPAPEGSTPDRPAPAIEPGSSPSMTPEGNPLTTTEEEIITSGESAVSNTTTSRSQVFQTNILDRLEPTAAATPTTSTPEAPAPTAAAEAPAEPDNLVTEDSSSTEESAPASDSSDSDSESDSGPRNYEIPGRFQADAFYGVSTLRETGSQLHVYGLSLGYLFGEKTQYTVSTPIFQFRLEGQTVTSYGLNFNAERSLGRGFSAGAHASGLLTDFAEENSYTGSAGLYTGYSRYLGSKRFLLSAGALLDVVGGKHYKRDFIGAVGLNLGIALSPNWTINPNIIYFRNFNTPNTADPDFIDLGLDLKGNLGDNWSLIIGTRATIEANSLSDTYQISIGSEFRF